MDFFSPFWYISAERIGLTHSERQDGTRSTLGKSGIKESEIMAAAKEAGMVAVKVARFSETHTANKFVIPVSRR